MGLKLGLRQLRLWLRRWWYRRKAYYRATKYIDSFAEAEALEPREIGLIVDGKIRKWAVLQCPCGCGERIYVNLMRSSSPFWEIEIHPDSKISLHPSLYRGEGTCESHFVVRKGVIKWCRE